MRKPNYWFIAIFLALTVGGLVAIGEVNDEYQQDAEKQAAENAARTDVHVLTSGTLNSLKDGAFAKTAKVGHPQFDPEWPYLDASTKVPYPGFGQATIKLSLDSNRWSGVTASIVLRDGPNDGGTSLFLDGSGDCDVRFGPYFQRRHDLVTAEECTALHLQMMDFTRQEFGGLFRTH